MDQCFYCNICILLNIEYKFQVVNDFLKKCTAKVVQNNYYYNDSMFLC